MSLPRTPQAAKLVIGLFMNQKELIHPITDRLIECFGSIDMVSPWFDFTFTDYYNPEMGSPLYRRMLVFDSLIHQSYLAKIKQQTNAIENRYSHDGKRSVNIDPGYLLRERFVLATGKNFSHRIYIGRGIYADLTLIYRRGKFQPLDWTYADYAEPQMHDFLMLIRKKYIDDLKLDQTDD